MKLANNLQSGNVIMLENEPVVVIKAQINKSGRNQAVVKVKAKNLLTNRVSELIFKSDEKLEGVMLDKKECKYSYFSPPNHVFVDSDFNEYEIDAESISDLEKYLVSEMEDVCEVTFFEGRSISVVLPKTIIREVEYTEPVTRGDTSGKITKAAILKETKHELQVSAFVEIGDKIEIDTETGEFKRRCT
ncbi:MULTISPECIES: elongation factor P [unclassified Schlesneria]|uniref:elongation factor P n=1 Tax=Schlesneria TaxID=656899 RepID=UPI00359FB6D7